MSGYVISLMGFHRCDDFGTVNVSEIAHVKITLLVTIIYCESKNVCHHYILRVNPIIYCESQNVSHHYYILRVKKCVRVS